MMPTNEHLSVPDADDFTAMLARLWAGRVAIMICTAAVLTIALAYAFLATPMFRSEALVRVRELPPQSGLAALATQFGGLAELAGVTTGEGSERAVAIATLKSRALVSAFMKEYELLPALYPEEWDPDNKQWKDPDKEDQPTVWTSYRMFTESVLRVSDDKKTGLVTISIEWRNPADAQRWVTGLINKTNHYLRDKTLRESQARILYLHKQISETPLVPLQQALFALLEAEQKKMMLAQVGEEFALQVIDPPDLPERRFKPKRTLVALLGLVLGALAGVLFVAVRTRFNSRDSVRRAIG